MGSRRRRSQGQHVDPFQQSPPAPTRVEDVANVLYGGKIDDELRRAEARSARIKSLALDAVRPDPAQARRVMPVVLRAEWLRHPERVPELLQEWLDLSNKEAVAKGRSELNVPELLGRDPDNVTPLPDEPELEEAGPVETSFRAVVQLAASIRLHGLANPITVVAQPDATYLIESGERRLLAYSLLNSMPDYIDGTWDTIPARVVEEKNIWRQAAENGARLDLNAISMARQLALLLMDIYKDRFTFARYEDMPGVEWYAQVYDAKKFPVPYGRGAELAAAMGLKSAAQIRQYRQLLALPAEAWEIADELNWTEYKIRELLRQARSVTTVTDAQETNENQTESVTTVTDSLLELFRYNAGLSTRTPVTMQPEAPASTTSPGRRRRKNVTAVAPIIEINHSAGTITLHVDNIELLDMLATGDRLKVTLTRSS